MDLSERRIRAAGSAWACEIAHLKQHEWEGAPYINDVTFFLTAIAPERDYESNSFVPHCFQ